MKIIIVVLAVIGILIFAGMCAEAEFTADVVWTTKWSSFGERPTVEKGKLYVKGSSVREEKAGDGYTVITIIRYDKGVKWVINPATKQYYESGFFSPLWDEFRIFQNGKGKRLGIAIVKRYLCDKTQYTQKRWGTCTVCMVS